MNFSHVRVKLVLSRKWTFLAREAFAAITAGDYAPELLCKLVDRIVVTN